MQCLITFPSFVRSVKRKWQLGVFLTTRLVLWSKGKSIYRSLYIASIQNDGEPYIKNKPLGFMSRLWK